MKNSTSHASSGARRAESHRQAGLLAHRARRWDEAVREFERAGFTDVALVQIGDASRRDFLQVAEKALPPALRG